MRILIRKLACGGFFHIFSTSVLNKIISMLTSIVIVRVVSKEDYGYFSYAYNIITTLTIFSSLGTTNTMLQYGCETIDENKRRSIEKTLMLIGFLSNIIFSVVTFMYAMFIPLSMPEAKWILVVLAFLPVIQFSFTVVTTELRILERNKEYALLTNVQTVAYAIAACLGGYLFSVYGTSVGSYIGFLVPSIVGFYLLKSEIRKYYGVPFEKQCKEVVKYSFWILLNNASTAIFYHLDVLIIGIVIAETTILADYRVATQIPTALAFIPVALSTFVYPYFVRHQNDPKWVKKSFMKLQLGSFAMNFFISIICIIFANPIINILYGKDYTGAVYTFRVLMVSFLISSTFRNLAGQVLTMLHQVKANFYMGMFASILNIAGDYFLINKYGSIGAAYATLIVVIFESIVLVTYLYIFLDRLEKRRMLTDSKILL